MSNQLIDRVYSLVSPLKTEFEQICSEPTIAFKRESEFAMQIFANNGYLAKVAIDNPISTRSAIMNVAAIGISLNPAQRLAYLVPRKNAICLDISYIGLMHIAQQTGAIRWCQSAIVRNNDQFRREGIDRPPVHIYNEFDTAEQRGDIAGMYVVVKTGDGDYLTHTMRIDDIYAIRDRSEAWKAYKAKGTSCPWVTDPEQMILKTGVKQSSKYWPRRERLDAAIDHVNTEGQEGINFAAEQQPERDITPAADDMLMEIGNLLSAMNKTWNTDLRPLCATIFRREISEASELTREEAVKVVGFLKQRAAA